MIKRLIDKVFEPFQKAWWLEISTASPRCEYYFGPFASEIEAAQARPGYVEDLELEGSTLERVAVVRRSPPAELTVEYADAA